MAMRFFRFPLASKMEEMRPSSHVKAEGSKIRDAREKAFGYAVCYSEGWDFVQDFVVVEIWPLGHDTTREATFEMVKLPIFGEVDGMSFLRYGLNRSKGETDAQILVRIEGLACEILNDILEW